MITADETTWLDVSIASDCSTDLGISVGQNVAGGYRSWEAAIGGWHDEVKLYVYGRDPASYLGKGGWVKIGHYTQVDIDI